VVRAWMEAPSPSALFINTVLGGKKIKMESTLVTPSKPANRVKFIIGGILIIAAVVYLIISNTQANAQYFMTIDELKAKGQAYAGHELRISGAVIGNSIQYDPQTLTLKFSVANVPGDNNEIEKEGGLAAVLHAAVSDPNRNRIQVVYNGVKPDLLKDEAQAIMTGKLTGDGVFHATELLLKCPTKYEDAVPSQVKQQ
jgi:cytochrome c-type biogenesis protein CcmE